MDSNELGNDASTLDTSVPAVAPEKVFTQEEVNRIVGARAKEAAEKARREALVGMGSVHQPAPTSAIDEATVVERAKREAIEEIRRTQEKAQQEYNEQQRQGQAEKLTKDYFGKLTDKTVKERYTDADEVLGEFNHAAYPNLIMLANRENNTADLMYYFAGDPIKAAQYEYAAATDPIGTEKAIKRLATDIEQNISSKQNAKKAQPPLSRMSPSNIGAGNEQPLTVADWRKHPVCKW